jgi:putative hydrolase of the HAD superfamily
MKQSVKAVIFDFGGVLSQHPRPAETRRMSASLGIDPEAFLRLFHELRPEYDRGRVSPGEYWDRLLNAAGRAPEGRLVASLQAMDLTSWTHVRRIVVRWASRLRRGGWATAVLSNMPRELMAAIERRFRWLSQFAPRIYSCQVGWNKPEPEIFKHCLSRLGLEAQEALFLDDHPDNVAAARRLGLHAVVFESPRQCARELAERFDIPALAPVAGFTDGKLR